MDRGAWIGVALIVLLLVSVAVVYSFLGDSRRQERYDEQIEQIAEEALYEEPVVISKIKGDESAPESANVGSDNSQQVQIRLPSTQKRLVTIVDECLIEYNASGNELQRSACRAKRKKRLETLFGATLKASGWIGKIETMGTNSEGKAHVTVALHEAEHITLKTWNNSLSDIDDNTLIETGTPIYKSMMMLSEGQLVKFSATLIHDSRWLDYIREASFTEAGSMEEPEFICKIRSIEEYK